ncbi:MAG: hypothetical protein IJ292_04635 [Clostridia bacterium]|nr:hypothetical protein [Clostridia bacterium]
MEKLIKYTLDNMTPQQLKTVLESNINLDCSVDSTTKKRIKQRTRTMLGLESEKAAKRNLFSWRLVVCACFTVLIFVSSVIVFREPLMNVLNTHIGDNSVIQHHQGGNNDGTKYDIKEKLDFSTFDFSNVDKIVIKSGTTGQEEKVYDVQPIINEVKKIKAHSPVSSFGCSNFNYNIKIYTAKEEKLNISIVKDKNGVFVLYGIYEKVGKVSYPCKYLAEGDMSNLLLYIDKLFE